MYRTLSDGSISKYCVMRRDAEPCLWNTSEIPGGAKVPFALEAKMFIGLTTILKFIERLRCFKSVLVAHRHTL